MKVLVVDDEIMICEWLEFCISQNPLCQLTGVAHNGAEALELFQKEEPDLVLTDVKMPVMDGLEFLHALRSFNSRTKVVFLTAFSEFDLIRQALRDGASEYLLKTEMQNDVLQDLLNREAGELHLAENRDETDTASISQAHYVIGSILRQNKELTEEELENLRRCNIRWRNNGLFALAVWKKSILNGGLVFPGASQIRHVAGFDYTDRIYVIVGNFTRTLSEAEKAEKLAVYAGDIQKMNNCMVGISAITDEMRRIPLAIWQASCSLGEGFYEGKKRVYVPRYPLTELFKKNELWKNAFTEFNMHLYQAKGYQRYELLDEFLKNAASWRILAVESLCGLCRDTFELLEFEAKGNGISLTGTDILREQMEECISLEEARRIMEAFAGQCHLTELQNAPKSKNIQLAVEYINAHYAEQLSLEQVAASVYLNPDYFSRAFKMETGQTFVNYLTDVRLSRSVWLLENTALRVQMIAQQVGYYNASYFSTIFKKKYGMSPYEYRRKEK
ncbi:response regulator receiver domain protein [Marvinbryantia formatexigens DSM 14469]|uniref:Stage 0 sporulation protein A homolog n=1 Tax=Marvinbryantia formatexigens DSM 14469 TaxID=478749 RepID=C6LII8_9FIRM|nr:response regulator [Marvinbryantia formatexigens]EET59570.1 response regulator receiver domain protein [Marvinbryantia formatexigens DSM 14469]UWO26314.1 response regulator [Marvinbryantia formatexigens DSM 14469]SDG08051.1 Two-component response regulator, YesN/AraC family, consists of REC and AraC-type DNA-binding domains [Marvinbryantia formatexigens]